MHAREKIILLFVWSLGLTLTFLWSVRGATPVQAAMQSMEPISH